MLKTLAFLLCTILVAVYATCRGYVSLTPGATCGPQQTMFNEGECLCCYYDTESIPTIGIGFNLQRGDAAQIMSKYNLALSNVLKDCTDQTTNYCLTNANAADIFNTLSYPEAAQCADLYAPGLPPVIRAAIIDVAFAGCKTLNQFVKMGEALNNCDWKTAAAELRNSKWCGQVKNRCDSDYNCIANYNGNGCTTTSTETTTLTTTIASTNCGARNPHCCAGRDDSCYTQNHCFCDYFCTIAHDCCSDYEATCSNNHLQFLPIKWQRSLKTGWRYRH